MTPDPQLRVKQLNAENATLAGLHKEVTFALTRGKVARILGFCLSFTSPSPDQQYSVIVRKSRARAASTRPTDILWLKNINGGLLSSVGSTLWPNMMDYTLPKPYRTTHLAVQFNANTSSSIDFVLLIYYDIDDMIKGEATQVLEKTRQVGNIQ